MSWTPLDPYAGGPEDDEPTDEQIAADVAYFKKSADRQGLPHDPEWDTWVGATGANGLAEARKRFGPLA